MTAEHYCRKFLTTRSIVETSPYFALGRPPNLPIVICGCQDCGTHAKALGHRGFGKQHECDSSE
jgi:hypothetical protein